MMVPLTLTYYSILLNRQHFVFDLRVIFDVFSNRKHSLHVIKSFPWNLTADLRQQRNVVFHMWDFKELSARPTVVKSCICETLTETHLLEVSEADGEILMFIQCYCVHSLSIWDYLS